MALPLGAERDRPSIAQQSNHTISRMIPVPLRALRDLRGEYTGMGPSIGA